MGGDKAGKHGDKSGGHDKSRARREPVPLRDQVADDQRGLPRPPDARARCRPAPKSRRRRTAEPMRRLTLRAARASATWGASMHRKAEG